MSDMTPYETEPLRIVASLRERYEGSGEQQYLRPVYLMALGMAAFKIVELEKQQYTQDSIDLRLDEEIEEMLIKQAHEIISATARPYPWWKNIFTSAVGGIGTLVIAASAFAFLKYAHSIGLISNFW